MKRIIFLLILLLGISFADMIKGNAYVISAIGIKNAEGNVVYQSGDSNALSNGTYKLAPQVIIYDGKSYVGAATPFSGCIGDKHYANGVPSGSCFTGGLATSEQDGLMSKEDKNKLENLSKKMANLESDLYKNVLPVRIGAFLCNNISVGLDSTRTYYSVNGTNQTGEIAFFNITRYLELVPGETYKILGLPDDNPNIELMVRYADAPVNIAGVNVFDSNSSLSDTFVYTKPIAVFIAIKPGASFSDYKVKAAITRDLTMTYETFEPYGNNVAKVNQTMQLTYIGSGIHSGENERNPYFDFADLPYGVYLVANTDANYGLAPDAVTIVCWTGAKKLFYSNVSADDWYGTGANFFSDNGSILYGRSVSWYANLEVWRMGILPISI